MPLDAYVTVVPTGLEQFAIEAIRKSLSSIHSYECTDLHVFCQTSISDENLDALYAKLQSQTDKAREKKLRKHAKIQSQTGKAHEKKLRKHAENGSPAWSYVDKMNIDRKFGTAKMFGEREMNIGYFDEKNILSTPGCFEGQRLLHFKTNAPPQIVAQVRAMGCGPLIALVASSCNHSKINCSEVMGYKDTLEDASHNIAQFIEHIGNDNYKNCFSNAMSLWSRHAIEVWANSLDVATFMAKKEAENTNRPFHSIKANEPDSVEWKDTYARYIERGMSGEGPFRYRLSFIRSYSKEYCYKREDLIPKIAGILDPVGLYQGRGNEYFAVDLKNYDFEIVLIILENTVSVGITLRPYQLLGSRGFSNGTMPPDVTSPYISGAISQTITRLRPSLSALLWKLSGVKKGEIVLDPCAGVGSIPVEASFLSHESTCFGIGGDIAIRKNNGNFDEIVSDYIKRSRGHQRDLSNSGGSDMVSWDASILPIRDSVVECIISDLPFGVRCMSSAKLVNFLPLLFSECARVLRLGVGRMVLLCGNYHYVLNAIDFLNQHADCSPTFHMPPRAIFPVNIGGLAAWIIIVNRTSSIWRPFNNHRQKVSDRLLKIKGRNLKRQT
jgi:tRNA G10  N-methylase Trm11